ncbi:MAG: TonB-dependent receptor plug domain-containing protein [Acidobacteria bacterium]|nr:TonB-dependent receptor plug domain-containing protein [Acidobacteriota bacterium]
MRKAFVALTALLFSLAAAGSVRAQSSASVVGVITDASGGVLEGAQVLVLHPATGVERATTANEAGAYRLPGLPAGLYRVRASFADFKTAESSEFPLHVGQERRVDLSLEPGAVTETITVEESAAAAATESATVSTVVDRESIATLPLNGRQLQNLALLAPGVTAGWNWTTASNRYGKARENTEGAFVVNGARSRSNDFLLDGMPMNVRQYGVINFQPSNEAVQEFELKTSVPQAEFGRTMGSTVNIITRSGSNAFHGSAYEFFRNNKLDSNDTFNKRAGLPRGVLRQNQFGASVGGPIVKNKHFFFGNVELLRILEGVETRVVSVPTADERAGRINYVDPNGAAQTLDLSGRITPLSARLLDFYPAPNSSGPGGLNYNSSLTIALNDYQTHFRTDHHLTDRDTVNVRASWNLNDQDYVINRFGGPYIPGFNLPNPESTWNGTIGYLRVFGPSLVNELRVGVNRYANDLGNGDTAGAAETGLPNGNETANGIPSITFLAGNIEPLGGLSWFNREQNETTGLLSDSVSWLRGRHEIKVGGQLNRLQFNTRGASNQRGTVSFDGSQNGLIPNNSVNARAAALADFLLGLPRQASITVGQFGRGYRQWAYSGFAQDTWRTGRHLTLNLGLRYEYSAPWTEVNGKLSNLVAGKGLTLVGDPGLDRFYQPDRNNFAPRVGLAYDVSGDGKTVVRAGAAVLYETLLQANSVQPVENNPPFSASAVTRSPTPFAADGSPSTTLLDLRSSAQPSRGIAAVAVDDFHNPYTMQFQLSVQRRLSKEWLAELAYTATRGLSLPVYSNLNQVPLDALSPAQRGAIAADVAAGRDTTATLAQLRLFPQYDAIQYSANVASSTFHSGQAKIERRFGDGLLLLASYTFGKSIDNASDFGSGDSSEQVLDARDLARQRGLSSFDVKHRLSSSFHYPVPLQKLWRGPRLLVEGWQLNGIVTLQSGQPFTPYLSSFDPYRNETFNRPDVIGDPLANVPDGLAFNPAAFVAPAPGTFGNAGRNIIRGDGFQSVDLSIFKRIALTELVRLELRGEFVNSFNQVNFQGPDVNLASNPGVFRAAAQPRIVQLGAKLIF